MQDLPHISIAMPDGQTCRAFFPFEVYDEGKIVRMSWDAVNKINEAIDAHINNSIDHPVPPVKSIESPYLPGSIELRETLTNLPHSPERTQLPHLDLSALRVY
jgi:hypothetical protein